MKTINYLQTAIIVMVFATVRSQPETLQSEQHDIEIADLSHDLDDAMKVISHQKAALDDANKKISQLEVAELSELIHPQLTIGEFAFEQDHFNIFLLSMCGFLALVSVILFAKFRSANALRAMATESLANLEDEHQEHLRISLEREQKLRRQLQDELNRHKIAQAS